MSGFLRITARTISRTHGKFRNQSNDFLCGGGRNFRKRHVAEHRVRNIDVWMITAATMVVDLCSHGLGPETRHEGWSLRISPEFNRLPHVETHFDIGTHLSQP
jgi:hypothetical protein